MLNKLKNIVNETLVCVNKFRKTLWVRRRYWQHQKMPNGIVYFDYNIFNNK